MLRAAVEHNIEFHFLPPHTTHQLQPLDVGIFGPLQRKWQERCDEIISETNTEVPRSKFVKEYMDVRNKVFTSELIKSAWKKAGMWPLDPRRFTEKDFAPSKLMSYATCLPSGYPELSDAPDILVYTPGNDENEGVGDSELVEVMDGELDDSGEMDEGMRGDGDGDEICGGDGNETCGDNGDEIGRDKIGRDEIGRDNQSDDEMDVGGDSGKMDMDVMNASNEREEPVGVGEVTKGAISEETETPNNSECSLRYERESHHLEQPTLISSWF